MEVISKKEELLDVIYKDFDFILEGPVTLSATLRPEDRIEWNEDTIVIVYANTAEVVTIERSRLLYRSERARIHRERVEL